jgi:pyridoxal 5'-phosphate synthase pdxT subunit
LPRIGVLALQGAFREHMQTLNRVGVETVEVRLPRDLEGCDGLVLPGGETTTQRKLAKAFGLWEPIRILGRQGLPMLATCAGLILLSRGVEDGGASLKASEEESSLGLLNVDVLRNAYGRQVHSFEARMRIPCLESVSLDRAPFAAIFIRAPVIRRTGPDVSILGVWEGSPVAVEQGNVLGLTFHPELTQDDRFHLYFLNRIRKNRKQPQPRTLATGRA